MAFSGSQGINLRDDIRIDWKCNRPFNHPYVKIFEDKERELALVMFLIDVSGSREFGTVDKTKKISLWLLHLLFLAIQKQR